MALCDAPLLTIAYSSLAKRADSIDWPKASADVDLLLCVQGTLPAGFNTPPHVRLVPVPGIGVAKSRNASITHARSKYLLFCDDDVHVDLDGVRQGITHLQATGKAVALGQLSTGDAPRKRYATKVTPLTLFNSAKVGTPEILIDVAQVRQHALKFDERFGAGSELHLGDEYIFITDLLRAGLKGDAIPATYGTHPAESSGSRWSRSDSHIRAIVLNRIFGWKAPAIRLSFALKSSKKLGSWRAVTAFALDNTPPTSWPLRT